MNPVADSLSHIEQVDCPSPIDWKEIADMQQQYSELKKFINDNKLQMKSIKLGETVPTIILRKLNS